MNSDEVFIVNSLKDRVEQLTVRNERLKKTIGVASTIPPLYKDSAADLDQIIFDRLSKINDLKKKIIEISNKAYNNVSGTNVAGGPYYSCGTDNNLSSYDSRNFILAGTAYTFSAQRGAVGIVTSPTPTPVPGQPTPPPQPPQIVSVPSVVSAAPVYPDTLRAWQFPDLEDGINNGGNGNPKNNGEYQTVTSANTGIGLTSNLFFNSEYNGVFSGTELGTYYEISGASTIPPVIPNTTSCNIKDQISELEKQIEDLRSGLQEIANGADAIKEEKTRAQMKIWGYEFNYESNVESIIQSTAAINVIESKSQFES